MWYLAGKKSAYYGGDKTESYQYKNGKYFDPGIFNLRFGKPTGSIFRDSSGIMADEAAFTIRLFVIRLFL